MSSINFDNAYLLLIAVPLVVLLTVPFFIAVRKDNANGHNIASGVIHVLIAILVAFTAAGTKIVTVVTQTHLYVVADVSYSANRNLDLIDDYISQLSKNLPRNTQLGVVCFGKDFEVTTRLGERLRSVKNADVDDSETDIVGALDFAGALLVQDEVIKRIVLITDGRPTDTADANALKREVDILAASNIHVDAIYVDDNISLQTEGKETSVHEVQVSGVEFTKKAYLNHSETVTATIQSSYMADCEVALYCDGQEIEKQAPTLAPGINQCVFKLNTASAGTFNYEVRVICDKDANSHNNSNFFTQEVTGSVNVLLISGDRADETALNKAFGGMAKIDSYIKGTGKLTTPRTIEALSAYDEIVISNIDVVNDLNSYEVFEENLETCVTTFGKSLITIGNVGLQNAVNQGEKLKGLLPVTYGNASEDKKLYTIILDASRSMSTFNNKLAYAKRAALTLIDTLSEDDSLAIVIFYGEVSGQSVMLPPIRMDDVTEVRDAKQFINNLGGSQGTFIGNALNETLNFMAGLNGYGDKQVMLITDGENSVNDLFDPEDIVQDLLANGIVTSVFNAGGHVNGSDAADAERLLQRIAQLGMGNYSSTKGVTSEDQIKDIIFGDVAQKDQNKIITDASRVNVARRYDGVLSGLTEFPYIGGYVNSKAKGDAITVLTTDFSTTNGTKPIPVPVYAYCNKGNGKVAAFTSSMSGDWIARWESRGVADLFFSNMFDSVLPSEQTSCPFVISTLEDSGYSQLTLTPASLTEAVTSQATIEIKDPDGKVTSANLIYNGSVFTSAKFKSSDVGRYEVTVTYVSGGNTYTADASFNVSYKSEYNSFAAYEASSLHKMIGEHGTVSEDGKLSIVNDENEVGVKTVSLTVPLMIAAVSLFIVDIIIRKLKWEDIKSLFKKVNKR